MGADDDSDPFKDFWQARTAIEGPRAARFHEEHDAYDLAAIAALGAGHEHVRMLDIGCGTCVIPNLVVDRLGWTVHAVDYVPEFLTHALDDPRLSTELGDVRTYRGPDDAYDVITLLGVLMYLDGGDAERAAIYEHCAAMLAPGGALLVKAQFGVRETVRVETYSEDLATDYRAIYWSLDREAQLLRAAFGPDAVTVADPYPPEFHRYENTHTHHLIARS